MEVVYAMIVPGFPRPAIQRPGFDPSTPIGTFIKGGYFTGMIWDNGERYAILVAPKASGQNNAVMWKNAQTAGPVETQTLTNGPAATAAMVAAGSSTVYPMAHWAAGLNINGFNDWYIPARDELELIFRNLKPTTTDNFTGSRTYSSIIYDRDGDQPDDSGDTAGINRNSSPAGAAYTTISPAQTGVALFQSGGAEAMNTGTSSTRYWSSTELANATGWSQAYANANFGLQGATSKNVDMYARAVRREKV